MIHKLILDFGNTLKKIAVFQKDEMVELNTTDGDVVQILEQLKIKYPQIQRAILSSVIKIDIHLMAYLKANYNFIFFTHEIPVPIINKYKTPKTLGKDRLAAAVGAVKLFPEKNILVIDAGSSITYEIISKDGAYLGGAITPGIKMRAKSLNNYTDLLPIVDTPRQSALIGNNTDTSLKSGIINGTIAEVRGMIENFLDEFDNLHIIFTGGDAYYFDKRLKYDIFASENLVLKGLNYILDYNEY